MIALNYSMLNIQIKALLFQKLSHGHTDTHTYLINYTVLYTATKVVVKSAGSQTRAQGQ